ncbi:MAG: hypothetical protein WCS65_11325 [Verrucomicrobiae bacterium]
MITGIPNLSGTQANVAVVQYNPSPNVQAKASALTGEIVEVKSVGQPGIVASLREAASQQEQIRPDMLDKGSAFLADPNYPPLDSMNGIASIFIDDFFLKKLDGEP